MVQVAQRGAFNYPPIPPPTGGDGGITTIVNVGGEAEVFRDIDPEGQANLRTLAAGSSGTMGVAVDADVVEFDVTSVDGLPGALADPQVAELHGLTHRPNESDGLATGVPVAVGTANAAGTDNTFARATHVHAPLPSTIVRAVYFQVEFDGDDINRRVRSVGNNGDWNFDFDIPADFATMVGFVAIGAPEFTNPTAAMALSSDYALAGQNRAANQGIAPIVQPLVDNEIFEMSLLTAFGGTSLAAGHSGGIKITHSAIGGTVNYYGLRLVYLTE